jgi:hypothetical protein
MLRMTEGPKNYLNAGPNGPFAFAQQDAMDAYNMTEWLFDYALDAVEAHGAKWEDFGDARGILSAYPLIFRDDETGEIHEQEFQAEDITQRGVTILNAAIRGQDVEPLFEAWRDQLYEEANTAR